MQRIILIFITLFISSMSFAYEEICLAGDTTTFKFSSNQLPENLSLPNTEFDSSLSACNKAVSLYDALLDGNGQKYFSQVQFFGVQDSGTGTLYCDIAYRKWGMTTEFQHDFVVLQKITTQKDCSCPDGQTRDFNGACVARCPNGSTWNGTKCVLTSCPDGQHVQGSTCVDDEEEPEQCPSGYYLGDDNFCHKYVECEPGKVLIDGECSNDDEDDLDVCDPDSKLHFVCQWYHDWTDWWNDYVSNEEQSLSDRQEIMHSIDDIRQQDQELYDQIRQFLENNQGGSPSDHFPIVQFPPFCEWSTVVCDWYLDYKEFTDDVRGWMDEYGDQIDNNRDPLDNNDEPYQIIENDNVDLSTTRYFNSSESCPIDRVIPLSLGGYTSEITISYRSLCDAAVMFKPFVILMSFMAGIFIITNTGRRAETGD